MAAPRALILLLVLLGACSNEGGASADSGDAAVTHAVDADAFKTRLQARLPDCARKTAEHKGLSEPDAEAFCTCQLEIIAAKTTPEERDALLRMTFPTEADKVSDQEAKAVTDTLLRLQPEVNTTCTPHS